MWRVASHTPFCFERCMFVSEWTLFVRVTLYARRIRAGSQSGLLEFKTAMRIVAIATLHRSFEDFVMERLGEIGLGFTVATHAELRFGRFQQLNRREARFLSVGLANVSDRTGQVPSGFGGMRRMAIRTAYVVAPVLATPEVIVLFPARMAGEASFRDGFGRFILERNDLRRIAFFGVSFARPVTRFTTRNFSFPTADLCELGMRSMRKSLELIFVTVLAGIAADVVPRTRRGCRDFGGLN